MFLGGESKKILRYNAVYFSAATKRDCCQKGLYENVLRRYKHESPKNNASDLLNRYRRLLGVSENCDCQALKNAFLQLAKKYHPDSGTATADSSKFAEVEVAYRTLKQNINDSDNTDDVYETLEKHFDIKHTAPQHRQYLNYCGIGYGTPSQRQKQYEQHRIRTAMEHVYDYKVEDATRRVEKTLIQKDAALARQYKSRQAMERLVEDLILESMRKGDFDNLPGSGKPLKYAPENPYVDSMTHKLNEILINNGFTPEWIVLEKEIGESTAELKRKLVEERANFGPYPLSNEEAFRWRETVSCFRETCKKLNGTIDKFNMIVPLTNKQKIHFQLEKVAQTIIQEKPTAVSSRKLKESQKNRDFANRNNNLIDILWSSLFK